MAKIVLDDNKLNQMATNAILLKEFPFLNMMTEGKGCCGKKATRTLNTHGIRNAIAALSDADKTKLRELLGGETVLMHHLAGQAVKTLTF